MNAYALYAFIFNEYKYINTYAYCICIYLAIARYKVTNLSKKV